MVGLLLVTHNRIGYELLLTAKATLGDYPLPTRTLAVTADRDPDEALQKGKELIKELDQGDGVLILTDCYGSTPSNIATRLGNVAATAVVSGANLPMLIRILNYPDLQLSELVEKAVTGGRDGVVLVSQGEASPCQAEK